MPNPSLSGVPFTGDFKEHFKWLFPPEACFRLFAAHGPRRRGARKLSSWQWLMARVHHALARAGTFATHVKQITGISLSDSALSQRGQSIGWKLLAEALPAILRPLAEKERHPEAFHQGLRLVAVDGTRFNLRNTGAINREAHKRRNSKGNGQPAFAQLLAVVLVELGQHQPLAATLGWQGEGEMTLARELFASRELPARSLLLADRLFGSPWLLWDLQPRLESAGSHYLVRVKDNIKVVVKDRLADGSSLVDLPVRDPATRRKQGYLAAREIRATLTLAAGGKSVKIRLWTSLLDEQRYPALELVELYARRWEQELFFRELKESLGPRGKALDAQTPESAAQEVLARLMGASLIAAQRAAVADHAGVEVLRISYAQVLEGTMALSRAFELSHDLIGNPQREEWARRLLAQLAETAVIPKRKPRSCQRAVRQPVKDWPKMRTPTSMPLIYSISLDNP
ncbi:IS4 family transposase [Luteolibacter sp. LG18]|uniref:IS4 family transposase n=1 Tax=Luteolibacter sp. LG18 TaxID=2819286 RepID=UPI0030C754BC